jgi:hypothetical protein
MTQFYQPASGQVFTEDDLRELTGYSPNTEPTVLATNGIYILVPSPDPYDPALYVSTRVFTIDGYYAYEGWEATPLPLNVAKANANNELKVNADAKVEGEITSSGFSVGLLTGVASQPPETQPAIYRNSLDTMFAVAEQLSTDIALVEAATTVDEINAIVNKPKGVINAGRGSGLGPEDLNPSYYVEFNSSSVTADQTELYVPGTATVIPYNTELPAPYTFDSLGDCFNPGDYRIQIREVATSSVISEFEVPFNVLNENVTF